MPGRRIKDLDNLVDSISEELRKSTFSAAPRWPKRFTVCGRVSQTYLEKNSGPIFDNNARIQLWAARQHVPVEEETRRIGVPIELVTRVSIPDEQTALRAANPAVADEYTRQRNRIRSIVDAGFPEDDNTLDAAKTMRNESDADFAMFVKAAVFFRDHDCSHLTPRQVPLEGYSAKWLGRKSSARRSALAKLVGESRLEMRERPGELRFRYLDPAKAGVPDQLLTEPYLVGERDGVKYAVIVENKDTYLDMPPIRDAICVFGNGMAAVKELQLLPELFTDVGSAADVTAQSGERTATIRSAYWGDMDADGFEILAKVREAGVDCDSFLMDRRTYRRFHQYGTNLREGDKGRIELRTPVETVGLSRVERQEYEALCSGHHVTTGGPLPVMRLEQERIPLYEAVMALRELGFPVVE